MAGRFVGRPKLEGNPAFLITAIELLLVHFMLPTGQGPSSFRPLELSLQIYSVARDLLRHTAKRTGSSGRRTAMPSRSAGKGCQLAVRYARRLLDHLQNTKGFIYKNLLALIIDEADRILEIGFEEEMNQIMRLLPKTRQTMLFSATQTKKVEDLALEHQTKPVFVGVGQDVSSSP